MKEPVNILIIRLRTSRNPYPGEIVSVQVIIKEKRRISYYKSRQQAFEDSMLHFDHPLFAGGVSLVASDNGEAAEKIRKNVEVCPLWLSLWRNAYAKLPPKGKRVLMALAEDWRSKTAAKIAGVSRPTIIEWKRRLRTYFFTSYRAWRNRN